MALPAQQPFSSEKPQDTSRDLARSLSSSPRQFPPTDLTSPILEEGGESESESPNEPTTPISGRNSQDFTTLRNHDAHDIAPAATPQPAFNAKAPLVINTAPTPSPGPDTATPTQQQPLPPASAVSASASNDQDLPPTPLSRRATHTSTRSFRRTMSNIFRRTNSQSGRQDFGAAANGGAGEPLTVAVSDTNLTGAAAAAAARNGGPPPTRRFSMNRSSATTRSNSPPSPGSPLEMVASSREAAVATVPTPEDFRKKNRASTGFLGRRAVNFSSNAHGPPSKHPKRPNPLPSRRRASSFDSAHGALPQPQATDSDNPAIPIDRLPWAMPAEVGTGVKARRMSLSLPDDFTVDVADLLSEFEYQHKILGRHGKGLGRGATCKVTLMTKKGCPGELYAVKEFRGKSRLETAEEYEKKIKSEYSLAKSLHHPNIVETVRLCTDHGRWNHVMEYCSEGDLYSLVQKGYLKGDARINDRACLFKQLLQGVNYLHANGIAHRDIKLENLLITKDSKLKITDFGVSDVFSGIHPGLREAGGQCGRGMGEVRLCPPGICGSEPYIAPEVLAKKGDYDPRPLDVWSSAIIMIYLTFGGAIWERAEKGHANYDSLVRGWNRWNEKHKGSVSSSDGEVLELARTTTNSEITDMDYPVVAAFDSFVRPPALRRVLIQMLNPDPARRINITEIMANRWFRNVECCQLESYEDPTLVIDASKKTSTKGKAQKIYCHTHLPPKEHKMGTLPKMPQYSGF